MTLRLNTDHFEVLQNTKQTIMLASQKLMFKEKENKTFNLLKVKHITQTNNIGHHTVTNVNMPAV